MCIGIFRAFESWSGKLERSLAVIERMRQEKLGGTEDQCCFSGWHWGRFEPRILWYKLFPVLIYIFLVETVRTMELHGEDLVL